MVQEGNFLLDNKNMFCNDTGRIMTGKHLNFLLPVLNSELFFFAVKHFYGGGGLGSTGIRMKHTFFENFAVPKISSEAQKPFIDLVDQILEITSTSDYNPKNPPVKQKELEKQIDELVYKLYDLTEEEIGIIEDSSKE